MNTKNKPDYTKIVELVTRSAKHRRFWTDDDLQQVFWLGVMDRIESVRWTPMKGKPFQDPIEYLVRHGSSKVRHWIYKQYSSNLERYCDDCNKFYGYRTEICPIHKVELPVRGRYAPYIDERTPDWDEDVIERYSLEQFVDFLAIFEDEKTVWVAKRWLVDRVDVYYDNHSKQLALELDISAPRVAQIKKKIREILREWNA